MLTAELCPQDVPVPCVTVEDPYGPTSDHDCLFRLSQARNSLQYPGLWSLADLGLGTTISYNIRLTCQPKAGNTL